VTRTFYMKTIEVPCPECGGHGWVYLRYTEDEFPDRGSCDRCWGTGILEEQIPDPNDILKELLCDSK